MAAQSVLARTFLLHLLPPPGEGAQVAVTLASAARHPGALCCVLGRPMLHVLTCSVAQSCPTPCDPMDCSTPGFPVHYQLLELAQTHVHQVGDTIQPPYSVVPFYSCLQSSPASGSFPVSQFFASGGQSIGASASASVLLMNILLRSTGFISLHSKGLSRVFSNITVQNHQFFHTQLSLWFNSHIHTQLLEKP